MPYTTPVTDRVLSDVTTPTSKGLFNVADWTRIYRNAQVKCSLVEILLPAAIIFPMVSDPTVLTIPAVANFNALLAAIEDMRLEVLTDIPTLTAEIKDDYLAGGATPNYVDVNLWESTIDAAWVYYGGADYDACPTLSADLTVTTGNNAIYIDCLDAANYNIDLQGTANLYII